MSENNKIGTYRFVAEPFHVDFTGRLTMGVLGNHLLNCAGFHATERGFGIATLNEDNYTWVLSRLAIELDEMPYQYEDFSIQTWVENVCDEPCPIEKPSRIKVTSMEPASSLNARYSDIDINGHVNSIRYIEHILDLFPIELYKESRIRRFEMAYVAESYYDDELTFYKDYVGDGTYDVEVRKNGNEVVCRSKVIFVGK